VHLGRQLGYDIRFEDMTELGTTFLKYVMDSALLREAKNDPNLDQYSTIILDEAHERALSTDILMGLLKSLAEKRKDLKIIIMSVTLTPSNFKIFSRSARLMAMTNPGSAYPWLRVWFTMVCVPLRTCDVQVRHHGLKATGTFIAIVLMLVLAL
jgi:HrpA-like RNA helicase